MCQLDFAAKLEVVYMHEDDDRHDRLRPFFRDCITVVNAVRPLSGDYSWEGPYFRGIHYAACKSDRFLDHWQKYDAKLICICSNESVMSVLRKYSDRKGLRVKLEKLVASGNERQIKQIADVWLKMPYLIVEEVP